MKKFFAISLLCCSTGLLWQCQRDDICPEATQTTPLLIIEFLDYENPEEFKPVPSLTVRAVGAEEDFISQSTTTNIAIPLKTDDDYTDYEFIYNDPPPGSTGPDNSNTDVVSFSYAVELLYLNRACGYIANYNLNNATTNEPLTQRWIREISVEQLSIENETNTHIYILH